MAVTQIFYANLVPPNAGGPIKNSRSSWLSCCRTNGGRPPIGPGRKDEARLLENPQWIVADRKRKSSKRENLGWEQRAWEDDED
jgi:hypothetical protein